ncbi:hypothetical protein PanWU01x14_021570, partial [Parasponia andersonii]
VLVDNVVTFVGNKCHILGNVVHPPCVILVSYSSDIDGLILGGYQATTQGELAKAKRGKDEVLTSFQEALSQIETLRSDNEALQSHNAKLEEKIAMASMESEIQVRGQMAKDYLADYETLLAMGNPQEDEENDDALATSVEGMSI